MTQREGWLRPQVQDQGEAKLPVVVVSAVRASLTRLKEFPLLAYLPKPFPIEALLRLAAESARREHVPFQNSWEEQAEKWNPQFP